LLVIPRRREAAKKEKDLASALAVFARLAAKGEMPLVRELMHGFPQTWQKTIVQVLQQNQADQWVRALA